MNNLTPLVLNWHLTEACNYRCQYCYATWEAHASSRELINDPARTSALLAELSSFFQPVNKSNPLAGRLNWNGVRLNLAGGEPTLYSNKILPTITMARDLGFEVSMISNGSLLDDEMLTQIAPYLCLLGISLDSTHSATNTAIGRVDRHGRQVDVDKLAAHLNTARQSYPQLRIKLNSVVNRLNHAEDLTPLLQMLSPDRWKVLRMLPIVNDHLTVTDEQFSAFVTRHQRHADLLCAENHQDMRESYIMIDPAGRFFQNSPAGTGQGYVYSRPILKVGAEAAFAEINFIHQRFCSRYAPNAMGDCA